METKTFKFEAKSIQDDGAFSGYLAVFGNVDKGGDRIRQGAFTKTLLEREVFPLFYVHQGQKIPVGDFRGTQDNFGLKVDGQLYISDFEGKPLQEPRQLHVAMKRRSVTGMSIGFDTLKADKGKDAQGPVRDLLEVKLYEGSVVPWPMNERAQVLEVKSAEDAKKAIAETLAEIISWKDACAQLDDGQKKLIGDAIASLEALSQPEPPGGTPGEEPPDMKSDPAGDQLLGKLLDEIEGFYKILGGK